MRHLCLCVRAGGFVCVCVCVGEREHVCMCLCYDSEHLGKHAHQLEYLVTPRRRATRTRRAFLQASVHVSKGAAFPKFFQRLDTLQETAASLRLSVAAARQVWKGVATAACIQRFPTLSNWLASRFASVA